MKFSHFVLVLFCSTIACSSSAAIKQDATNAGSDFVGCAKADLTKLVGIDGLTILGDVAKALTDTSSSGGWSTTLSDLETKVGGPLVGCAVDAVKQVFSTLASTTARPTTSSGAPLAATVLERADTYAKTKKTAK